MQASDNTYTFKREGSHWYIYLPNYLEEGWDKADLQLLEGAPRFLNQIANGARKVRLRLSAKPLPGADLLQLVQHCDTPKGGAVYLLLPADEQSEGALFWICDLALLVFGEMPDRIYVRRMASKKVLPLPQPVLRTHPAARPLPYAR